MSTQPLTSPPLDAVGAGCCPVSGVAEVAAEHFSGPRDTLENVRKIVDPSAFVGRGEDDRSTLHLMVENMSCAACIMKIERVVLSLPEVQTARVNMSTRRLAVEWRGGPELGLEIVSRVSALGYPVAPFNPELLKKRDDETNRQLLAALAVAGFAAANVMLLSVAVWAGAFSDMGEVTRNLFHWISALIALPAVAYAGQPFFRSAVSALKNRTTNMDVPISLAVLMAAGMSLQQTIVGGQHAYFDASVSLLFFLLIGRYLDLRARAQARTTAEHLLALNAHAATVLDAQGQERSVPCDQLSVGMTLLVAAGQRIAADGRITSGQTEIDASLLSGETLPVHADVGDQVYAGTLNVGSPLEVTITAISDDTLLGEIVRLVETAEQGRAKYVRIAERASRKYVPIVHAVAAATFVGWFMTNGGAWEPALLAAVAVLIITCPCALALAVPVVQVIATGVLLRRGIIVKSADGLERLAECDYVVFDKTGTLTKGQIELLSSCVVSNDQLAIAAGLARRSHHPISQAIVNAASQLVTPSLERVEEIPGKGLTGFHQGKTVRLGRGDWLFPDAIPARDKKTEQMLETWLLIEGESPVRLVFSDQLRADAGQIISSLLHKGVGVELLSGDRSEPTQAVAKELGITQWESGAMPSRKVARLAELSEQGYRVLMIGDGLNDAPALASGHASISPSSAADISQTAADLVFQGSSLQSVLTAMHVAKQSGRIVRQNFALAIGYNFIAVPIAVMGLVTPLIAAIAMSSSSLLVTLNALRLKYQARD